MHYRRTNHGLDKYASISFGCSVILRQIVSCPLVRCKESPSVAGLTLGSFLCGAILRPPARRLLMLGPLQTAPGCPLFLVVVPLRRTFCPSWRRFPVLAPWGWWRTFVFRLPPPATVSSAPLLDLVAWPGFPFVPGRRLALRQMSTLFVVCLASPPVESSPRALGAAALAVRRMSAPAVEEPRAMDVCPGSAGAEVGR